MSDNNSNDEQHDQMRIVQLHLMRYYASLHKIMMGTFHQISQQSAICDGMFYVKVQAGASNI